MIKENKGFQWAVASVRCISSKTLVKNEFKLPKNLISWGSKSKTHLDFAVKISSKKSVLLLGIYGIFTLYATLSRILRVTKEKHK